MKTFSDFLETLPQLITKLTSEINEAIPIPFELLIHPQPVVAVETSASISSPQPALVSTVASISSQQPVPPQSKCLVHAWFQQARLSPINVARLDFAFCLSLETTLSSCSGALCAALQLEPHHIKELQQIMVEQLTSTPQSLVQGVSDPAANICSSLQIETPSIVSSEVPGHQESSKLPVTNKHHHIQGTLSKLNRRISSSPLSLFDAMWRTSRQSQKSPTKGQCKTFCSNVAELLTPQNNGNVLVKEFAKISGLDYDECRSQVLKISGQMEGWVNVKVVAPVFARIFHIDVTILDGTRDVEQTTFKFHTAAMKQNLLNHTFVVKSNDSYYSLTQAASSETQAAKTAATKRKERKSITTKRKSSKSESDVNDEQKPRSRRTKHKAEDDALRQNEEIDKCRSCGELIIQDLYITCGSCQGTFHYNGKNSNPCTSLKQPTRATGYRCFFCSL